MFVARIHNNSLGACYEVESEEKGIELIQELAESQFERPLTDQEINDLHNFLEVVNFDDADNHYTWAIGTIE